MQTLRPHGSQTREVCGSLSHYVEVCIATNWPGAPTIYNHTLLICKSPETESLICYSS